MAAGSSPDCIGNGIPDECEPDCDGNGTADSCDMLAGAAADCNGYGVLDSCDLDAGLPEHRSPRQSADTVVGQEGAHGFRAA